MTTIDLNCDMGELWNLYDDGTQAKMLPYVSSVNVACGAHAGDERLMELTIRDALAAGVAIGAHPGYPDRENFGRIALKMSADDLVANIVGQLETFARVADACGAEITHVKPHGALYNVAVSDSAAAEAIALAVQQWGRNTALVGLAGSGMLRTFTQRGFATIAEAFADRRYNADGTLQSRNVPGAVISDPDEAAEQVLRIVRKGLVSADTICLHSDTPGAVRNAARIHAALVSAGIAVQRIQRP